MTDNRIIEELKAERDLVPVGTPGPLPAAKRWPRYLAIAALVALLPAAGWVLAEIGAGYNPVSNPAATDPTVAPDSTVAPASTVPAGTVPVVTGRIEIPDGPGVAIEATGTVVEDRRGTVLCPGEWAGPCPGLPLSGDPLPEDGDQVRVGGRYDGVSLSVTWVETWEPETFGPLTNPCTGRTNSNQAPEAAHLELDRIIAPHRDRYAGAWIADGEIVVGLTGPADAVAAELDAVEGICAAPGFAYSEEEISRLASEEITPMLAELGPPFAYGSVDSVPVQKLGVSGDAVDLATIDLLEERYDLPIEVETFILVLDAPVSELPAQQPFVAGDVNLPTETIRSNMMMAALWTGAVFEYDPEANCLFVEEMGGGSRVVVVWPFGYTAVAGDPTQVFDPAGNVVAETGVPVDLGGGYGSIDQVDPSQRCGATDAWIGSP